NPVLSNGGQLVADAFMRIYGIDIKRDGPLNMAYLDVERKGRNFALLHRDFLKIEHVAAAVAEAGVPYLLIAGHEVVAAVPGRQDAAPAFLHLVVLEQRRQRENRRLARGAAHGFQHPVGQPVVVGIEIQRAPVRVGRPLAVVGQLVVQAVAVQVEYAFGNRVPEAVEARQEAVAETEALEIGARIRHHAAVGIVIHLGRGLERPRIDLAQYVELGGGGRLSGAYLRREGRNHRASLRLFLCALQVVPGLAAQPVLQVGKIVVGAFPKRQAARGVGRIGRPVVQRGEQAGRFRAAVIRRNGLLLAAEVVGAAHPQAAVGQHAQFGVHEAEVFVGRQ
ncbi:MAG: hypothetical protein K2H62_04165, partial [Bacteroidales bacterium]|nr:hypothetical protein [Bacteroidales bacterium]